MATIQMNLPGLAGQSGLTLEASTTKGVVYASAQSLTEGESGVFSASFPESFSGYQYELIVRDSGGEVVHTVSHRTGATSSSLGGSSQLDTIIRSDGGYEFTGGFADRTTGQAGASAVGSNVSYTQDMVNNDRWLRFGFDSAQQVTNDSAYWTEPTPSPTAGIGLFGGDHMPSGVDSLFDFSFSESSYSDAVTSGDLQYTAADGSLDFSDCRVGDLALVRFDFNVLPQIANTTLEVALIWQTRLADGTPTFTFALTGDPMFYGTGTVGRTFLARPLLSAYFASNEDINAKALLAIKSDNPVQIQPLTTLMTIQR